MKIAIACFILLITTFFTTTNTSAKERIAVIGAGAAGIKAASLLTEKGEYDVTLFEKRDRIGGKVDTRHYPDGSIIEHGAIQVGPFYNYVMTDIKKLDHKLFEPNESYSLRKNGHNGRGFSTKTLTQEYVPRGTKLKILQECNRLNKLITRFNQYKALANVPDNSEFLSDFETFADSHNVPHLKEMYRTYITPYGYGELSKIPTFLPLAFINASYGLALINQFGINLRQLENGYGGLLDALVKQWHLDIRYSYMITNIDRFNDKVIVTGVDRQGNLQSESFSRIIIACPIDKIYPVLGYPTEAETTLDEAILYNPYHTIVAPVEGLPYGGYVLTEKLNQPGHLQMINKNTRQGQLATLYIPQDGPVSGRSIRNNRSMLNTIEHTIDITRNDLREYGLELGQVEDTRTWNDYFPHFNKPFFYGLIDAIQGDQRTYYIGTMSQHFDFVNMAFQSAVQVVDKHFSGKPISTQCDNTLMLLYRWYFNALPKAKH